MSHVKLAQRVAYLYSHRHAAQFKYAGPLTDVSKLRYQAVFLMGPAGSGKSYLVDGMYMKYMPGAPPEGVKRENLSKYFERDLSEAERGLTNVTFDKAVESLRSRGFEIELAQGGGSARIPFRLYTYDETGGEALIDPSDYGNALPKDIYQEVKELESVIYRAPKRELPSYWRQVNPDLYKEELIGYREGQPGFVHEMSSQMSKGYFAAALESGDPMVVDGTGPNLRKMTRQIAEAKAEGYQTSVVYVYVPLTISLLRNAARARKVDPFVVLNQWKAVHKNYPKLRGFADKAKLIDNSNPSYDAKLYQTKGEGVDQFMRQKTIMSLAELVLAEAALERSVLKKLGAL
jgi:predicted kinase